MVTILLDTGQRRYVGAVLFDMDGTLTRPYLDFGALRQQLGLPEGDILAWVEGLPAARRKEAMRIIEAFEEDGARHARWNDGAPLTLDAVRALGISAGIITRNSSASLHAVCARLGLSADLMLSREDAAPKPAPDSLCLAANHFGVPVETVVLVGDYRHDTDAARAAGAVAVLLTNGLTPAWPVDADVVIERLPQLMDRLK